MADFTFAIVVPLASPIQPVATLNMTHSAPDAANLIGARGALGIFKMILVELGVNSSMPAPRLACVRCRASRRASVGTNRLVTQRNKRFCRCTTPNSACYLASIALHSPDRSRLVSSGEAAFCCTWFAALGSIAIFAHGGGYARLEAHRSHRCAHEQGRLRPWPHRIPTIS